MKKLLDKRYDMRELLFARGYLLTDDSKVDCSKYPFYNLWNCTHIGKYRIFVHPKQKLYVSKSDDVTFALVGHAFNPFDIEEYSETVLLNNAIEYYKKNKIEFTEYFNKWTGIFNLIIFENDGVCVYNDAAGMYMTFYGIHNGKLYCSSHTNLLGDICNISFDSYVERLINYRFYSLFGKSLPGDLSPYREFKRLIPNHFVEFKNNQWHVERFFLADEQNFQNFSYDEIIAHASQILSQSMRMIYKKWPRAAVSLTGGCDSKTTLSCTNGIYDKYSYFSYDSSQSEYVDADAAAKICQKLNIPHKIYKISNKDEDYKDIEVLRKIMEYNSGSIGKSNANDVRKRMYFLNIDDFDVEIKSWVSEIGRAYYHKRFAKKKFPKKLTAKYATCLYKVFITDRKLVRDTEKVFEDFLNKYYTDKIFDKIPWYDLFFWEFRVSSWNGLVITGEQHISYDIVIPYNNRILLKYFISTPVEKRIKDEPHLDIMKKMNPQIADCGISVTNLKHTNRRARFERLYLEILSKFPF